MTTTYPYLRPDLPPPPLAPERRSGVRRALPGPVDQPRWVRPSALALLAATALLYLWNLGASGNANQFYAAAVQAGTQSWKAMFFGSLDSGNFITVDKPPASLWPMEIAGRIFGFNSWSMLVPQALMGVAAVGLLYLTVKRWFGPAAGLIAGGLLAVTPVAVLMFRFNNPDALMTLLLVVAAYGVTRAIDDGKLRWLLVAGAAMGFDFLTKSLQPFTVLPALAFVYLVAANTTLGRRIRNLLLAGAATVVSAGWWVLAVTLTPASSRPYIGGSGDNSVWGLAWGYNGLSRLTGGAAAAPGGGQGGSGPTGQLPGLGRADFAAGGGPGGGGAGGGGGFGGSNGLGRMFNSDFGTQISWLLPAALLAIVALFAAARWAPRTDRTRAAALLWGGWLLVTAGVFSYASGIIHPYYAVQLAPAIAALVAIGAVVLWRRRAVIGARLTLAAGVAVTGVWSYELMTRAADWHPYLRYAVLFVSLFAAVVIIVPPNQFSRRGVVVAAWPGCSFSVADRRHTRRTLRLPRIQVRFRRPARPRVRRWAGMRWRAEAHSASKGTGAIRSQDKAHSPVDHPGKELRARPTPNSRRCSKPPPPAGPRQPQVTKVRPASNWQVAARRSWRLVAGVALIRRRHSRNSRPTSQLERSATS